MKKAKKSLLALIISMLVIIPTVFTGCEKTEEESYPKNQVAMWEVTSKDTDAKLYLLGTIHVAKADTFPLREEITKAFDNSDYLAVEANINEFEKDVSAQVEIAQKCLNADGSKINDHISQETYEKAKAILVDHKLYADLYDMYCPYMWSSLVDNALIMDSDFTAENGVDHTLIDMADEKGKEVLEVESMSFQTDLLLGFSDELYEIMIRESVDNADTYKDELNKLYDAWHNGDTDKAIEVDNEETQDLTDDEKKIYEDYNTQLLTDRNVGMADKAEQYLSEDKNVFFAVGFMHMVGDDGLVALLKDRGYTVTRV